MRRSTRLRLLLRDLGATAAFGSMAISGQLPIWALGIFAGSLVASLRHKRVFARRTKLTAAALLVAAAALYATVALGGMDLLVAACSFAGLITAHRMLSEDTPRTELQVHLAGLLMIAGGASLSGQMTFALCLLAFAVCATLSVGLAVMEAASPEGEEVPVREVLGPLSVGLCFALLGTLAFFVLFPRMSWNVYGRRNAGGDSASTGFSSSVRLGGASGTLKTNPRVALRAELSPDPEIDALNDYWIGRTYDRFDGQEWTSSGEPTHVRLRVTLFPSDGEGIRQHVELLPAYGARTLIALEQPLQFANANALGTAGPQRTQLIPFPGEVQVSRSAGGYTYDAISAQQSSVATSAHLSALERSFLLELPEHLDPRVAALAQRVLDGERDPLRAAHTLESYLQKEYQYSLELAGSPADPLADFLFSRKSGHCEQFATALTMLLRSQGIPARLATGFFGGQRVGGAYILRAGDAHAWTHVLTANGFVTVDATPPNFRSSQSAPILERLTSFYELLETRWNALVLDYSFRDQWEFLMQRVRPTITSLPSPSTPDVPRGGAGIAALVVALGVYLLLRRGGTRKPAAHAATAFATRLETALEPIGMGEAESLEQFTTRLETEGHPLARQVREACRAYLASRFGGRPLSAAQMRDLLRGLDEAIRAHLHNKKAQAA